MSARAVLALGLALAVSCDAVASARCASAAGSPPLASPIDAPFERAADPFPAPRVSPDTTVNQFLQQLADSTSRYFGVSAAAPDTTGLDSALAYGLAHPRHRRRARPSFMPAFAFNRVDGPVYSIAVSLQRTGSASRGRGLGEVAGAAGYATGPNDALWRARWMREWGDRDQPWRTEISGGLETASMDRERAGERLTTLHALITGDDRQHYLRREGWAVGLSRTLPIAELGVRYREANESAIATSAGWNLFRRPLAIFDNLTARNGRAHEVELAADVNLQLLPARLQILHQTSGHAIGSDFEYRRTRLAASGDIGLGGWAALVPQVAYGRLTGQPVPQAAFYLGGSRTIRGLPGAERSGTRLVVGRVELIGTGDVLTAVHVPHPEFLPIQLGVFAGAGAVWGVDLLGGPARDGGAWPRSRDWVSEAGVSAIYQPGLPDPTTMVRLNYAVPLGPERESTAFTVAITRAIDFPRRLER